MNKNVMNKPTETNLALFDEMTDEMIDVSEIPPLDDSFFEKASWHVAKAPVLVTIEIEPDIWAWFNAQGTESKQRLNAALRLYVAAHKSFAKELHQAG